MTLTIGAMGEGSAVLFACDELRRLLGKMDGSLFTDIRIFSENEEKAEGTVLVGVSPKYGDRERDGIIIDVKNGEGYILGKNYRSVLIAAYRFMYELGCRFLRPGEDEEIIPQRKLSLSDLSVSVDEDASYRHRGMCIEGAVSYGHVRNMIDWLPKVGMNAYFVQFRTPSAFFRRFYNTSTPYLEKRPVEDTDVDRMWKSLEKEVVKRGLDLHAVGHGWTCEPFGIKGTSWEENNSEISEEARSCLALIDGKRDLWHGVALNTNLCYSQKNVRDRMTDSVVEYLKSHPNVTHLHFWLGDGRNNNCECDECLKMRPSDYYVMMLNDIDRKLTAEGIDTKIVCLIYVDLLWAPEREKILNKDRFVLMFAPITRSYTKAFSDFDLNEEVTLAPFHRNRLQMPTSVALNCAYLRKWQNDQQISDSFDFDYHLMWDHYKDPGYYECAKVLHRDMAGLSEFGLDGMVSCQTQRSSFPTGLPLYAMAKALWDKSSSFEDVSNEYFTAAFGEEGKETEEYLSRLSYLFCPAYLRGEKPITREEMRQRCEEAKKTITAFIDSHPSERFRHFHLHGEMYLIYADMLIAGIDGREEERNKLMKSFEDLLERNEPELHEYFDDYTAKVIYNSLVKSIK